MSNENKNTVKEHFKRLSVMSRLEVELFLQSLYIARNDLDDEVFKMLREGAESVQKHFEESDKFNIMDTFGELREGEV